MNPANRIYRCISLSMALLLLVNTSGLTMDMHFCQGHLKRVNVFGKAKTCSEVASCKKKCAAKGKYQSKPNSQTSCGVQSNHNNCCKNDAMVFDMDYDGLSLVVAFDNSLDLCALPLVFLDQVDSQHSNKRTTPYINYKPPLIKRDIPILIQSFLL